MPLSAVAFAFDEFWQSNFVLDKC